MIHKSLQSFKSILGKVFIKITGTFSSSCSSDHLEDDASDKFF